MHPFLAAEVAVKPHDLIITRDLKTLLAPFRKEYQFPSNVVLSFVRSQARTLKQAALDIGFEPTSDPRIVSLEVSATEKSGTVEVRFESAQPFHDTRDQARITDGLHVKGLGLYNDVDQLHDVSLDHVRLSYTDVDGGRRSVPGSTIYAHLEPIHIGGPPKRSSNRLDRIDSS